MEQDQGATNPELVGYLVNRQAASAREGRISPRAAVVRRAALAK